MERNLDIATYALEVNGSTWRAWHLAACAPSSSCLKTIVAHLKLSAETLSEPGPTGMTPLLLAITRHAFDSISFLCEMGVDVTRLSELGKIHTIAPLLPRSKDQD